MQTVSHFGMDNKTSPFVIRGPQVRVALNGEMLAPGRFVPRRGIVTSVTVNTKVGVAAPFRIFPWTVAGTTYLIACGSDGLAFINPCNNYLYARTASVTQIYSAPATVIASSWGLTAPAPNDTPDKSGNTSEASALAGGCYAYKVSAYHVLRNVESAATEIRSEGVNGTGGYDLPLQPVPGTGFSVVLPQVSVPSGCELRWYRNRITTVAAGTGEAYTGSMSELRMIDTKATGAVWTDSGGQPEGPILPGTHGTVPFCKFAAWFDGRVIYAKGNAAGTEWNIYVSDPNCPETYPSDFDSVLWETEGGVVKGKGLLAVPSHRGSITGVVVMGDMCLILCEWGAWRLVALGNGLYGIDGGGQWTGCVSNATLAESPYGVWWLSRDGIVLWTGGEAPRVVTEHCLNPLDADTLFATTSATLATASGGYDYRRRQYVCMVPKSGGGQFGVVIRGDELPNIDYGIWTLGASLGTCTGMGYDPANERMVYGFGTTSFSARTHLDSCWRDTVNGPTGDAYDFQLEIIALANERGPELKHEAAVRAFIDRPDATVTTEMAVTIQGMRTTEEQGDTATKTLTWTSGQYLPMRCDSQPVVGRAVRLTVTGHAAQGNEIREIQIGSGPEMSEREGQP